ncbi:hypothetical protein H2198_000303 [Neophaeococcomyces mojaviensis]|uniref:Uncharacterized protein n=1 Tax=Neophaeococcomyces mojaviensis TaxID=3383035 RepID=A0ACC3AKD1_9EURO|nr:hypothetical protein H2198_000303 [Knufia sp. JES_112]
MSRNGIKSPVSDVKFSPNLRRACEECHQRKIRCQVSDDCTICNYCQSNNKICFFLPQNKSGRPKPSSGSNREKSAANITALSAAISAAIESNKDINSSLDQGTAAQTAPPRPTNPQRRTDPTPMVPPSLTQYSSEPQCLLGSAWDVAFNTFDYFTTPTMSGLGSGTSCCPSDVSEPNSDYQKMDLTQSTSTWNFGSLDSDWSFNQPMSMPNTHFASTVSGNSGRSSDFYGISKQHYTSILNLGNQLQSCFDSTRSSSNMPFGGGKRSKKQFEPLLKIVDISCAVSCHTLQQYDFSSLSMTQSGMNDDFMISALFQEDGTKRSLIALIVAIQLRILDVCDTLLEWCLPPNGLSGLDTLLIIKKLEVDGIQSRIALSSIQKIDHSFNTVIEDAKRRITHMQGICEKSKAEITL